jgi:hypothetical protein
MIKLIDILKENLTSQIISEGLNYHIQNNLPLTENVYRAGSKEYFKLWKEARMLYEQNSILLSENDVEIITETNLGNYSIYNGELVPLDFPFEDITLNEEETKKLNKPRRGGAGGKKYYVYVRDPKTKRIKKISFGDSGGLKTKITNPKARHAFAKRHKCAQKTDRTKASYWSCRIGRYWESLGGSKNFSGFW